MMKAFLLLMMLAVPCNDAFVPLSCPALGCKKRARSAMTSTCLMSTAEKRPDGKAVDYEVNLGKVIDTLREDYPMFLQRPPDYSIYTPDITLSDPSGIAITGISTYRRLFAGLRMLAQVSVDSSATKFRLYYDWNTQTVRVRWNSSILLKSNPYRPLILDGVSVYFLNDDGFVNKHKLENISINGQQLEPPFTPAWMNLDNMIAPRVPSVLGLWGTCDTSFDCDPPQICCNFLMFKSCCSQGLGVLTSPDLIPIPMPKEEPHQRSY